MSNNIPSGWQRLCLSQIIGSLNAGVSVNSDDRSSQDGEISVLKTSCISTGVFRPNENKVVINDDIPLVRESLCVGSVLISRMNTPNLVGASSYIDRNWPHLFLPDRLWQAKVSDKNKYNPQWLAFLLSSDYIRLILNQRATGTSGSMKNLSKKALLSIKVDCPPKAEQDYIAGTLTQWDKYIDLSEGQLIALQERRKWLMQKLLSSKHGIPEFSSKWVTRCMKDLVDPIQRPIPKPTEPYKALGIRSHCKGTFERLVSNPNTVDMEELYIAQKGDLIVNITFAWEGAIAFVPEEHNGNLISHRFPTYRLKEHEVDADFMRYVVTQPRFIFMLGLISPGGAGRNRVMSKRDFLDLEISVPCLEEQRMIGKILKLVDKEIVLLSEKLDALREQKKGLMQQLLTGKLRVKTEVINAR